MERHSGSPNYEQVIAVCDPVKRDNLIKDVPIHPTANSFYINHFQDKPKHSIIQYLIKRQNDFSSFS